MRRRSSVSIGPGAASLILIFVMLSMSVLAVLTLHESLSDAGLSERSIQVAQEVGALYVRAEESKALLGEALSKQAVTMDESMIERQDTPGDRVPEQAAQEESDWLASGLRDLADTGIGFEIEENEITWTLRDDQRELNCAVEVIRNENGISLEWIRHSLQVLW